MKILYFSQNFSVHDKNFLEKLGRSHHKTFFLPLEELNDSRREAIPNGVHLLGWQKKPNFKRSPENSISLMQDFERILKEINPDLIHAGPVQTCGFMTALSEFHPFLLMSWGYDILKDADYNQTNFWITKYTLKKSDWLVVDNNAVRMKIQSIIQYDDEKILQIPWGVDLSRFKKSTTKLDIRKLNGWEGCYVILSTRMWEPIYGILDLLEGFYLAHQENQNIRLILLGDGSLAPEVHQFIEKKNITALIHLPGIIDHEKLPEYFNSADFYLSCSLCDGSSISLLEAMATGLPPIVTNISGNLQWVSDKTGWLVSPGNPKDIARAITDAINESPDVLNRISYYNNELIRKEADWNANIQKLLDLYDLIEKGYNK